MTPLEYLKQADREMAAGNGQKAAGLMWKATEATFEALADAKGLDRRDLETVARALEKENPPHPHYFVLNLLTAAALRDHGNSDPIERYVLEEDILESFMDGSREFVLEQRGRQP